MLTTIVKMWLKSSEDKIIPLHPDAPAHENNYVHKERNPYLFLELLQSDKRIIIPGEKANWSPTSLSRSNG